MKKNEKYKSSNNNQPLNFIKHSQINLSAFQSPETIFSENRKISIIEMKKYSESWMQNLSNSHTRKKSYQKNRIEKVQEMKRDYNNGKSREKCSRAEFYTRNLGIPQGNCRLLFDSTQNYELLSQLKFPKLANLNPPSLQELDDFIVQSEGNALQNRKQKNNHINKMIKQKKRKRKQKQKNESIPLSHAMSIDNSRADFKADNIIKIPKINTKIGLNKKVLYEFQRLIELKEKVEDLMPAFTPIYTKKKERTSVIYLQNSQNQLSEFLDTKIVGVYEGPIRGEFVRGEQKREESLRIKKRAVYVEQIRGKKGREDQKKEAIKLSIQSSQSMEFNKQFKSTSLQFEAPKNCPSLASKINPPKKPKPSLQQQAQQKKSNNNKLHRIFTFIFAVNLAHRVFYPLTLSNEVQKNKFKYFIGKGNNSLLIKSLMKRRFWWVEVDDEKSANFVWTQLKVNSYYELEREQKRINKYDKCEADLDKKPQSTNDSDKMARKHQISKNSGVLRGQLPENNKKIFTNIDSELYNEVTKSTKYLQENKFLFQPQRQQHLHNHFMHNCQIGNKKALFYNLKHYYEGINTNPFEHIPLTFHIRKGMSDPEYHRFLKQYKRIKDDFLKAEKLNHSTKNISKNVWIVKPGELSNRGNGITVIDEVYELNTILKRKIKHSNGQEKTYIIQKYIEKPMLFKNRKFDIRHYMMISRLHGRLRAYWYSQGYIRTSSFEYNIEEVGNSMIHLTNDAVQKKCASYGKYEEGNKISYLEFQRYLDATYPERKYSFIETAYPRMKKIATDAIKSTYLWMDPQELQHNFQIFGLDFMIDCQFNVWLIEVNTNPCLELSSGLLGRIIPIMLENTLRLALDPLFPPPSHYPNTLKYLTPDSPMERLQYELIFDQSRDGKQLEQLFSRIGRADCGEIDEEDETYENDGKDFDLGGDLE